MDSLELTEWIAFFKIEADDEMRRERERDMLDGLRKKVRKGRL